jgi:DNA-directed RNA polymerase specialized sigma24 family protein
MNDAEYRRLLKILTVRACRAVKVAEWKGEDWILAAGKSPVDYAQDTLILWSTDRLKFTGTSDKFVAFLTKVMTNAIVSDLRKREVKANRSGKVLVAHELTEDVSLQVKPESLLDVRSLLRDDAFRKALDQCTADDNELQEYVVAIEILEDKIPAARDIADLLNVSVTDVYNRRKKLARRLGQHGFTGSRRRSKV